MASSDFKKYMLNLNTCKHYFILLCKMKKKQRHLADIHFYEGLLKNNYLRESFSWFLK